MDGYFYTFNMIILGKFTGRCEGHSEFSRPLTDVYHHSTPLKTMHLTEHTRFMKPNVTLNSVQVINTYTGVIKSYVQKRDENFATKILNKYCK
jgi:hypothetical protein